MCEEVEHTRASTIEIWSVTETGKAETRYHLRRLHEQLRFRPGERMDLKLTDEGRELVYQAQFKKSIAEQQGDIQTYLFDHAVLLVKVKQAGAKGEDQMKAFRKVGVLPVPPDVLASRVLIGVLGRA